MAGAALDVLGTFVESFVKSLVLESAANHLKSVVWGSYMLVLSYPIASGARSS